VKNATEFDNLIEELWPLGKNLSGEERMKYMGARLLVESADRVFGLTQAMLHMTTEPKIARAVIEELRAAEEHRFRADMILVEVLAAINRKED
jgi:hypothetical protein